jgi:hypothetical protein
MKTHTLRHHVKACGAAMLALLAFPHKLSEIKGARGRWPSHFLS